MKQVAVCALILMTSLTSAASDALAFRLASGSFDAKHFSSSRKTHASLNFNSNSKTAHLKISESSCQTPSDCLDMEITRLNQNFKLEPVSVDACNVKTFKGSLVPAARAFSKLHATKSFLMAEIEIRDSRNATCGSLVQNQIIELQLKTRNHSSVGNSALQFRHLGSSLAQAANGKIRSPALLNQGSFSQQN